MFYKRILKALGNLVILVVFCLLATEVAVACSCRIPSACVAFSRAERVFVGRVEYVTDGSGSVSEVVYFKVIRRFKGKDLKSETVSFVQDNCVDRELVVGKEYFVYADRLGIAQMCNRTHLLDSNSEDHQFASNIDSQSPRFLIGGNLISTDTKLLSKVKVEIIEKGHSRRLHLDRSNKFSAIATEPGRYEIRLYLPIETFVEMSAYPEFFEPEISDTSAGLVAKYFVDFKPNECDDRLITLFPRQSTSVN